MNSNGLTKDTVVPARSEQVVNVHSKNYYSLIEYDFDTRKLAGLPGIQVSKARILRIQVTMLNTESYVHLKNRTVMGTLSEAQKIVASSETRK